MAQLLHGSATTTARPRALFRASDEPATVLARRYGVNPKTVRQFGDAGQRRVTSRPHPFDRMCRLLSVEHRLTKPYHPWTNGQAERMVRTLKEATVRAFHHPTIHELRRHVADDLAAYTFAKHLKALRWRTPYETLEALWGSRPELFRRSPDRLTLGPNTSTAGGRGACSRRPR